MLLAQIACSNLRQTLLVIAIFQDIEFTNLQVVSFFESGKILLETIHGADIVRRVYKTWNDIGRRFKSLSSPAWKDTWQLHS